MYTKTNIGRLIRAQRFEEAVAVIVAAHRRTDGNTTRAAKDLRVHHATMKRWIARLSEGSNLRGQIDLLRNPV